MSFISPGTVALPAQPAVAAALPYAAQGTQRQSIFKMTGAGAFTMPTAVSLGAGGYIWTQNAGVGVAVLTAAVGDTLDGVASYKSYPGELRLVQSDGTAALTSVVINPFYYTLNSSSAFEKSPGYQFFQGLLWGGGASGGKSGGASDCGGGGGGACVPFKLAPAALAASETVTIGAGGAQVAANAAGVAGGNSTFGTLVTSFGGGAGGPANGNGGAGGGALSAGGAGAVGAAAYGGQPGAISTGADGFNSNGGFGGGSMYSASEIGNSAYGGGAGGGSNKGGGSTLYGGGGGGGGSGSAGPRVAGSSKFGGAGGAGGDAAAGADGVAPGGGGGGTRTGANSGAGAAGRCEIWGVV